MAHMLVDPIQLVVVFAAVLFAAIFRAFTGFGFALAAVPAFSFFLSPQTTVMLTASLTLIASALSWRGVKAQVDWSRFKPLVWSMIPGTVVGVLMLQLLSQSHFQLVAGIAVLSACLLLIITRPGRMRHSSSGSVFAGTLSGLMNGALALPGPPVVIYSMMVEAQSQRVRALLIAFFGISSLAAVIIYSVVGYADRVVLWYLIYSLPVLIAGNALGEFLFARYGDRFFRGAAITALFLIAISTIVASGVLGEL